MLLSLIIALPFAVFFGALFAGVRSLVRNGGSW